MRFNTFIFRLRAACTFAEMRMHTRLFLYICDKYITIKKAGYKENNHVVTDNFRKTVIRM